MSEVWKPVEGYNGLYEVSNHGNVRSWHKRSKGALLSPGTTTLGYLFVILYQNAKSSPQFVHRLVAQAFLGDCPDGMEVNHKDLDKENNHISNLEYSTRSANIQHSYDNGRKHKGTPRKLTPDKVRKIRRLADKLTYKKLGNMFGVTAVTISHVVNRDTWADID